MLPGRRFLLVTGDHGPAFERAYGARAELAEATHVTLQDYSGLIWDDAIADHTAAIGGGMLAFLHRMDHQQRTASVTLPERAREHVRDLFYRIQGKGLPWCCYPWGSPLARGAAHFHAGSALLHDYPEWPRIGHCGEP